VSQRGFVLSQSVRLAYLLLACCFQAAGLVGLVLDNRGLRFLTIEAASWFLTIEAALDLDLSVCLLLRVAQEAFSMCVGACSATRLLGQLTQLPSRREASRRERERQAGERQAAHLGFSANSLNSQHPHSTKRQPPCHRRVPSIL
jgi:hypothetical protein